MKILIETSILVSTSVFWEEPCSGILLKDKFFDRCEKLFNFLRANSTSGIGIITKTVENEAQSIMNKAVGNTIRRTITRIYSTDINKKRRIMILQDLIINDCINRLERIIVECSSRLPIDTSERERILTDEIEPTLKEIVQNTVRYIEPHIPNFIKGEEFRRELKQIMIESHPLSGVYKGMPSPRDMLIMAEATMITRKYDGKEKVYVASFDYHFVPNRIQIYSYLSSDMTYVDEFIPNARDPTARDILAKKFGFIGEDPSRLMDILEASDSETSKI